jgi:hypothetical protein
VIGPTTGGGAVRKILGSVVIGEGTTTMVTDMGISIPVTTQETTPLVDTSMESGFFSEEESAQTKHMSYEADHSADDLDTLEGENNFMNLSTTSTKVKAQPADIQYKHDLAIDSAMDTTFGEQLINVSMIQQEPEAQVNEIARLETKINVVSPSSSVVNTISPDKKEPMLQPTPKNTEQQKQLGEISNNDGFTVVQ